MAIDTEGKRRSAGLHHAASVDPIADGTIGILDRVAILWCYADYVTPGEEVSPEGHLDANQVIKDCYDPVRHALRVHSV